mmetsp:Transcript_57265/g.94674  ORF Transcript_57265/g.94674 Transcript_57265/m.94674 type:complete len:308 (+) Transcript_57265:76-999(+)
MLRRTTLFDQSNRSVLRGGGYSQLHPRDRLTPLPLRIGGKEGIVEEFGRHVFNVSWPANANWCDYAEPFACSTGLPLILPSARISFPTRGPLSEQPGSFVSHHAATRRSIVKALIHVLAQRGNGSWVAGVLNCVRAPCGYSEYSAISSWTLHTQPDSLVLQRTVDWKRVSHVQGKCPSQKRLSADNQALSFIGWEQSGKPTSQYGGGIFVSPSTHREKSKRELVKKHSTPQKKEFQRDHGTYDSPVTKRRAEKKEKEERKKAVAKKHSKTARKAAARIRQRHGKAGRRQGQGRRQGWRKYKHGHEDL